MISSKNIVSIKKGNQDRLLENFASFSNGIQTSDYSRFGRYFWELNEVADGWEFQLSTVTSSQPFGGREHCIYWQNGKGELIAFIKSIMGEKNIGISVRGLSCRGKKGVAISAMGTLKATLYTGELFDDNTVVLLPNERTTVDELWQFCSSPNYNNMVREVDQSNKVRAALLRVPYSVDKTNAKASIFDAISSNNPTQWLFHGHPVQTDHPLQVAVIRLLGYQWPSEQDNTIELSKEAKNWVMRSRALLPYADEDGIVCIPSVRGEIKAEDRIENLLAAAYGSEWSYNKRSQLLANADHAGRSLESWLRDKFFAQHCNLFHSRPFIWHIWDGLSDGFAALVNYHKLDAKLLETLIYTYLGDWISRQKQEKAKRIDGAEEKLAAAEILKKRLELILEGEKPYDIFVRWKPLAEQPIGWNPDLNDGVRLNIRPFLTVPDIGKKGAGVLRDKININWGMDRGRDAETTPWFKLGPKYGGHEGDRINEYHLSLAEKKDARKKISSK